MRWGEGWSKQKGPQQETPVFGLERSCSESHKDPIGPSGGSRILCLGGLTGRVILFGGLKGIKRRRRETAIAEGKKPLMTRGSEECHKLPERGLGLSARNRRDFEHFKPKWSTFWDPVNLTFHSFILAISIAPFQVLYHSEALPTTARILSRSFTPKHTGNCR